MMRHPLGFVWLGRWKSERIENRGRIEKFLVFLICVWLRGWKSGGMKNFLVWLKIRVV